MKANVTRHQLNHTHTHTSPWSLSTQLVRVGAVQVSKTPIYVSVFGFRARLSV